MALRTALDYMISLKISNGNETIFFIKGKKGRKVIGGVKGGVSAEEWLLKLSILPKQPPGIECINEDMATEMAQVKTI
jgi:hypothetical protein